MKVKIYTVRHDEFYVNLIMEFIINPAYNNRVIILHNYIWEEYITHAD
ncbi:hypothetical protein PCCS19_01820 [Paenibacillus sp. CCS19]|nr:hypothetical protein PCCS19_01820 [Paenibacillus cellulosilyticus]